MPFFHWQPKEYLRDHLDRFTEGIKYLSRHSIFLEGNSSIIFRWLCLILAPYIPTKWVRVDKLVVGAPAHAAGLRQGDEIVAVDGHAVPDNKTLNQAVSKADTPGA
jgi:membrane-associated protease RseP (regulator of RpoE activity)